MLRIYLKSENSYTLCNVMYNTIKCLLSVDHKSRRTSWAATTNWFQCEENLIPCVYTRTSNLADCTHESWLRSLNLPIISISITPEAVATSIGTHPISRTANYLANLVCRYFIQCMHRSLATSRTHCISSGVLRQLLDRYAGPELEILYLVPKLKLLWY
jgi:hypothetical protein